MLAQRKLSDAEEDIAAFGQLTDQLADNQWQQRLDLLQTEYAYGGGKSTTVGNSREPMARINIW